MSIKLTNSLEFSKTKEFNELNLLDQILYESYLVIAENINLNNSYDYSMVGTKGSWFTFTDKNSIRHDIKLNYNPLKVPTLTVKFYWVDEDNKPMYSKPPHTDEKVFNTHLKVFVDELLPKFDQINKQLNVNELKLDPNEKIRYRLYRIALNQVLDTNKYELIEDVKNLLLLIRI